MPARREFCGWTRSCSTCPTAAEPGHSATEELAGIMKAIRAEPGFAETCRAEIEDILKELPPQRRAELLPDEAAMAQLAQRLAASGADRILARMKGATS